ncbi:MAG: sigma 54-interacting transcriptional regulator [Desulfovermiculus sp.]
MSLSLLENYWTTVGRDHVQMDWRVLSYALVNASPNGVFLLDQHGRVLFANQLAQTDLGVSPGCQLRQALPEVWPTVQTALNNQEDKVRFTFQADGFTYFAKLNSLYWKRRFLGMLCIIEDTTELEEALEGVTYYHHIFQELEGIINSSTDGIWVCDPDATVLRINKASERLNNISSEDVVGRTMQEIIDMGLIDSSVTLKVIAHQESASLLQTTREGRKLLVSGSPVLRNDGKLFRVVVNERDVSELYSLQYELEEHKSMHQGLQRQLEEFQCLNSLDQHVIIKSENMAKVFVQAQKVAPTDSTALITGETGAGKGLLAKFIHDNSVRSAGPFIKINCGSIPETLLESELFGYEKGAFTGAGEKGKCGKFELAEQGTLFLDEISDLPPSAQVKLLHFLEDSRVTRVGGTESRQLDVRIIAASNKDLSHLVAEKSFRSDLFYRLNVIPLHLPSLRERKECLYPLIQHYVRHFALKMELSSPPRLSPQALNALLDYNYPGNVRELINVCERLVITCRSKSIEYDDLPSRLRESVQMTSRMAAGWDGSTPLRHELERLEKELLSKARDMYSTQEQMAAALGVQQSTVARKLQKHGLLKK